MTTSRPAPMRIGHPDASEYAPFYAGYVARVTDEPLDALETQGADTLATLRRIPESSAGQRYAEGKWTVRDIVGHMADVERIMTYRALRLARADATPLPGFEENAYAAAAGAAARDWHTLIDDLATVRASTLCLFRGFDGQAWLRRGVVNGAPVSVRALAHVVVGHERHHLDVLGTRYGLPAS